MTIVSKEKSSFSAWISSSTAPLSSSGGWPAVLRRSDADRSAKEEQLCQFVEILVAGKVWIRKSIHLLQPVQTVLFWFS